MEVIDSSSDEECNFYVNAAAQLKKLNHQEKLKSKRRQFKDSDDDDNNHDSNQPKSPPKAVTTEPTASKDPKNVFIDLDELDDNSTECNNHKKDNGLDANAIMFIEDDSSNDKEINTTPKRSTCTSRKRLNTVLENVKVTEKMNDSIDYILDDSFDNSFQLSQEDDSYVLIGSPPPAKENTDNYEVSVKVLWKSNKMERFEIKKYETFQKVFRHFANLEEVHEDQILITKKGKRITPLDTPDSIDWSILDILDGGIVSAEVAKKKFKQSAPEAEQDGCKIKIQTSNKTTINIIVKKNDTFKSLLQQCSKELNVPESKIKFYFDGDVVDVSDTPESLDLDDEACFDLKISA